MLGRRSKLKEDFDKRVTLQRRDESQLNAMNEPVEKWITLGDRWARIIPLVGREFQEAQETQASQTHRVMMRGGDPLVDSLTTKHRLMEGDRVLNITRIMEPHGYRSEVVEFGCTESV